MNFLPPDRLLACLAALLLAGTGCKDSSQDHSTAEHSHAHDHGHTHVAPHGGTVVVLGDEAFHLEFVLDQEAGQLTMWILDGHLENFVRVAAPSLRLRATIGSASHDLELAAVASQATGETVGDASMFAGRADWLKTTPEFAAVIPEVSIRSTRFTNVAFAFPAGTE